MPRSCPSTWELSVARDTPDALHDSERDVTPHYALMDFCHVNWRLLSLSPCMQGSRCYVQPPTYKLPDKMHTLSFTNMGFQTRSYLV